MRQTQNQTLQIAAPYRKDVRKAVEILKEAGCDQVFLFGSLASQNAGEEADIDLAVRGCPQREFFHLLGLLLLGLEHSVDLINLDTQEDLTRFLEEEEELVQIA
jgi:predicted nucleotidyltransferase